jgi:hypothetical protein
MKLFFRSWCETWGFYRRWRWREHDPPKWWKLTISLRSVTNQKTTRHELLLSSALCLDHGLDDRWFEFRQSLGIFIFTTASRPALGPTHPPIRWVAWTLSLGVKRQRRKANHSPLPSAEVKECVELYRHSSTCPNGMVFKHRDNFTFTGWVESENFGPSKPF